MSPPEMESKEWKVERVKKEINMALIYLNLHGQLVVGRGMLVHGRPWQWHYLKTFSWSLS